MKQTVSPWQQLLFRGNLLAVLVICGGTFLNALNIFILPPVLPTVVQEIGGLNYYAMTATLSLLASILGSAYVTKVFRSVGARNAYFISLGLFIFGSLACATAMYMPALILGRVLQGFGGGMLVALSYVLLHATIDKHLWPRMMGLTTSMWGLATLIGPALGGVLAQYGQWRLTFWLLIPAAIAVAAGAISAFPRHQSDDQMRKKFATKQLVTLTGAIIMFSVSALAKDPMDVSLLFIGGVAMLITFGISESQAEVRLLPKGAVNASRPYGMAFAVVSLISIVAVWSNLYVSYYLQHLHGQTPVAAGYVAALIAGGWTIGSIFAAGMRGNGIHHVVLASPILMLVSSILMAITMPSNGETTFAAMFFIVLGVFIMGAGPGMAWPHLSTWIMGDAPEGEGDLASGSIVLVQNTAMAIGGAFAGLIANTSGMIDPGGIAGTSQSAGWLYGMLCAPAVLCVYIVYRLIQQRVHMHSNE